MSRPILVLIVGVAAGWWAARGLRSCGPPLARFVVSDASMEPTLRPGDRLLVLRWGCLRRPRRGDVVVAQDPEHAGQFVVKRVAAAPGEPWAPPHAARRARAAVHLLAPGTYALEGDNRDLSRDSRVYGPVAASLLLGPAVWRYLPGSRRGGLSGR